VKVESQVMVLSSELRCTFGQITDVQTNPRNMIFTLCLVVSVLESSTNDSEA
jgi:hypothetical protein